MTQEQIHRIEIGELFLNWAENYFDNKPTIGIQLKVRELYDDFFRYATENRSIGITVFKKKLRLYSILKKMNFNRVRFQQHEFIQIGIRGEINIIQ